MPKFALLPALLLPLALLAQPDPHCHDERIEHFQAKKQPDSLRHYAAQKIQLARAADSLAAWGWAQLDLYYSLPDDDPAAAALLEAAWAQRWREPANAYETEPLLYLQTHQAWHHFQQGRVWQSVQAYEQVRQWYEQFQFSDFEAVETLYKPLGNHYTRLGDNDKALAVFQKTLPLTHDPASLAGLHSNIGIAHSNARQWPESIAAFRRGLALPALPFERRAQLLAGLAQAQLDTGQPVAALRDALTAARSPQHGLRARAMRTAANASRQLGRLPEAERQLHQALTAAKTAYGAHDREVAKIENDLALLCLQLHRPEAALAAANRALSAVLPSFQPKNPQENPAAAIFYEENTIWESLSSKAAAAEAQYHQSHDLLWLHCAAECHALAHAAESRHREVFQYEASKLDLQRAARARETAAMQVEHLLFEKTGQPAHLHRAFAIAERSKAALLLDALRDNLVRQRLAGADPRFGQLAELRRSRAFFEKNLLLAPHSPLAPQWRGEADALAQHIAALQHSLVTAYPRLSEAESRSSVPTALTAASQVLTDGEILLEYFVGQQFVEVFTVEKNGTATWHRFPNDAELQTAAAAFAAFFANAHAMLDDPAGYLRAAFFLSQKILPPSAATAERLLVVPDGFLSALPFEALVTAAPGSTTNLRNAAYLLRRQSVRYAWSAATLRQQSLLPSGAGRHLLAVAPMCGQGLRGLPALSASCEEWSPVRGRQMTELLDSQADWQRVSEAVGRHRLLHFSTHAFAATSGPEPPRIELYDRSAYLPDIYALPLQADGVVLSACQTGLGTESAGEGVMSLARAFAQSGAACVVSSLWTVNDRSTARLFGFFYEKIEAGTPLCAALHSAKLAYLDDPEVPTTLQSPYFWAGLVAVGDERGVGAAGWGWWWVVVGVLVLVGVGAWRFYGGGRSAGRNAG